MASVHKAPRRALLINPWIYDFAAFDMWASPLALLYLASILRENQFEVTYIDCLNVNSRIAAKMIQDKAALPPKRNKNGSGKFLRTAMPTPAIILNQITDPVEAKFARYGISPAYFQQALDAVAPPDIIFVTSIMTYWYKGVNEGIEILKQVFPQVPVILGGNYAAFCTDHAQRHCKADLIFNSDLSDVALYRWIEKRLDLPDNSLRWPASFMEFPAPALELVEGIEFAPLLTTLGCPFKCPYCATQIKQPEVVRRDRLAVSTEIEHWYESLGVRHFTFFDDALLLDASNYISPILLSAKNLSDDICFYSPNGLHANQITPELAKVMFQCNFKNIKLGFEYKDDHFLQTTGGKVKVEDLGKAIEALTLAGYQAADLGIYLICGIPGQKIEKIRESLQFCKKFGIRVHLNYFSPIPGTPLFEAARKDCRAGIDLRQEPLWQNNTLLPYRSKEFGFQTLRPLKRAAAVKCLQF